MRIALEMKIGQKLKLDHPVIPWLIRHAGHIITKCWVRPNGKTAYQMIRGRRSNVAMKEFGEAVYFTIPETDAMPGKFEARWDEGVYLGFNVRSGEDLVSTEQGVFRVSTVRRKPPDERWAKAMLDKIAGTPEAPTAGASGRRIPVYAKKFAREVPVRAEGFVPQNVPEPRARTWRIERADVEEHGETPGCPGCRAAARGENVSPLAAFQRQTHRSVQESDRGSDRQDGGRPQPTGNGGREIG